MAKPYHFRDVQVIADGRILYTLAVERNGTLAWIQRVGEPIHEDRSGSWYGIVDTPVVREDISSVDSLRRYRATNYGHDCLSFFLWTLLTCEPLVRNAPRRAAVSRLR